MRKLEKNPRELEVLGDANPTKPYLYIADPLDAIFVAFAVGRIRANGF